VSKHWPGPLTIILKRQPSLKMDLGDAEGTVALRVPDHELARDILRATGPMAVSSANISGLPAALTCDEAIDQLGASVSVYLDGGRLGENGQPPSTIPAEARSAAPGVDQAKVTGIFDLHASHKMPSPNVSVRARRPLEACAWLAPTARSPARTTAKEDVKPTRAVTMPAVIGGPNVSWREGRWTA